MLGMIHNLFDKSISVVLKKGDKHIWLQGRRLEVKLEADNHLRISQIKKQDNRNEQYSKAVSNVMSKLENHRKELALISKELKEIFGQLSGDLEEDDQEKLFQQVRAKKAVKKNLEKEIKKIVDQTAVTVNYHVVESGFTAVLPPGLISQPKFLNEPICWCPQNIPASELVEKTTSIVEDMPLMSASDFTASGEGLEFCVPKREAKFVVTPKEKLIDVACDDFLVESKEVEIESTIARKEKCVYEVTYVAPSDVQHLKEYSLAVTYLGRHIRGSPFTVKICPFTLLEFSTSGSHTQNWQDSAIKKMSNVSRAILLVQLFDVDGTEVYKAKGETKCRWTPNHITAPGAQFFEGEHKNVIELDNGDRMMIIGKHGAENLVCSDWGWDIYRSNNLIINIGWQPDKIYTHRRRLVIALSAPGVPGWTAPGNLISFSKSGFTPTTTGNWPKFKGTFRISCTPL